jgi:alpha-tubulin suppressor-like RCC1 family protein
MKRIINSMMKHIAVRGLLLAACSISLAMQPLPAAAGNNPLPLPGTVTTWGGLTVTTVGSFTPVPVVFPQGVVPVSISAYDYEGGLAITQDGSLYEWYGETNVVPAKFTFPPPVTQVKAISMRSGTLALTDDGLYDWNEIIGPTTLTKVVFPPAVTTVYAIAEGYTHSLAITDDGLYAWGSNWEGELGLGAYAFTTNYIGYSRSPVKVQFPATVTRVIKIAAGYETSYAITDDGLYSWGVNGNGQLANGLPGLDPAEFGFVGQPFPGKVLFNVIVQKGSGTVTSITEIVAGEASAMAITDDGLYAWPVAPHWYPAKVTFPRAVTKVKAIAAGYKHSLAITDDGLYAWGDNSVGQLGIGKKYPSELTPTKVPGENNAIGVAAAANHSIALH